MSTALASTTTKLLFGPSAAGRLLSSATQRRLLSTTGGTAGFDKVGVIGLGLMGHGVCQVAAASGVHSSVVAFEPEQKFLDLGKDRIEKSIAKLVTKGKMSQEDADETLGKIQFTTDMSALSDTDFIVEAVIENMVRTCYILIFWKCFGGIQVLLVVDSSISFRPLILKCINLPYMLPKKCLKISGFEKGLVHQFRQNLR